MGIDSILNMINLDQDNSTVASEIFLKHIENLDQLFTRMKYDFFQRSIECQPIV